jgi:hypothetical protein
MDSLGVAQKTQIKELFIGFSCLVSDESIVLILIGAKVEARAMRSHCYAYNIMHIPPTVESFESFFRESNVLSASTNAMKYNESTVCLCTLFL